ncbi:MAG: glycosyltransferase family 4 protein [Candidatus Aenigmarchaeota archaeon]|jgi:glycosyltransferase involved in cell wall biosynthesis|nr:glycosyltransferase family 4 protein [Candidatus Aenigmarchaeota archaeon]
MKLLIAHEIFPPEFSGGGEKLLLEIIKRLKRQHRIIVITSGNPEIKEFKGIKTVRVSTHRMLFNIFGIPLLLAYGKRADVLIGNTYHSAIPTAIASFLLRKPSICIVHGAYGKKWVEMKGILSIFAILLEKIIFRLPFSYFLFFSDFARKSALKLGVNRTRTVVISPGVEINKFKKIKKKKFVLFVGRLERQKGIDKVIEVAKRLPHVKFILVGKRNQHEKLNKFPLNVEWMGFVPEKTLIKLYEEALIFFLPSRAETLGYSILEAMAASCAIVSTVPLPYFGYRLKENDKIETIVKVIRKMIIENKKTERLGRLNRKIIRNYRWSSFIYNFNKLLSSFI